jgi:DsbC/DsbD-like thiol-disulfide interchange protein
MALHSEKMLGAHGAAAADCSPFSSVSQTNISRRLNALLIGAGLAALASSSAAVAQSSLGSDTVTWSASVPAQGVKPGGKVKVTLRGAVQSGWHVYGLQQLPDGPTPLRVTVDAADIATADGAPTGSPATKLQDPSFNLETQFYEHDFTVTAPVRIGSRAAAGAQAIALNVRFQTCNGRICQPPKTVRLSVLVNVQAKG